MRRINKKEFLNRLQLGLGVKRSKNTWWAIESSYPSKNKVNSKVSNK